MSACQHSTVSSHDEGALLSGNTFRVGLVTCLFVISRSGVRFTSVALLSPQQDNISLFVSFRLSRIAIPGFAYLSRNLDRNAKKNIEHGGPAHPCYSARSASSRKTTTSQNRSRNAALIDIIYPPMTIRPGFMPGISWAGELSAAIIGVAFGTASPPCSRYRTDYRNANKNNAVGCKNTSFLRLFESYVPPGSDKSPLGSPIHTQNRGLLGFTFSRTRR